MSCQDHHHDHKDKAGQWPARPRMGSWGLHVASLWFEVGIFWENIYFRKQNTITTSILAQLSYFGEENIFLGLLTNTI